MKNNPKLYKFANLKIRLKLAWMVFIGKADVLKWPA